MSLSKIVARKIIFPAITRMGIEKLFSVFAKDRCAILEYHGVCDAIDPGLNGRHLRVEQFEQHLTYLKNNFNIVSLTEMVNIKKNGIVPKQKTVALTFDDGFLNNYTHAWPLLKKQNVPAAFFIVTASLADEKFIIWPDALDVFHRYSDYSSVLFGKFEFRKTPRGFYSDELKTSLSDYMKKLGAEREPLLSQFKQHYEFHAALSKAPVEHWKLMSKEQVKEVHQSGLIEIGSHTHLHYNLGHIPAQLAKEELASSKKILEDLIQQPVTSIAYPDGSYTSETTQLALDCGYTNLLAVDFRVTAGKTGKETMDRFCVSNTTSFDSNMIQLNLYFNRN